MATLPVTGAKIPLPPSRLSYLFRRTPTHLHRGLDFPAARGTPVRAAESGIVEVSSNVYRRGFSGYGRVIVVKGDSGRWFLYAHLDRALAPVGARVTEGQKIGTVGRTTFRRDAPTRQSGGPHLHFEVSPRPYPQRSEASRLDPVSFLRGTGRIAAIFLLVGAWLAYRLGRKAAGRG